MKGIAIAGALIVLVVTNLVSVICLYQTQRRQGQIEDKMDALINALGVHHPAPNLWRREAPTPPMSVHDRIGALSATLSGQVNALNRALVKKGVIDPGPVIGFRTE